MWCVDHLCTCTTPSGAKKAHDWSVDQLADLFRTTHKAKTQQVVKVRGHHCGDMEIEGYLTNTSGPVPLVLDLRIAHDRFGSSFDPNLNGKLHYPNPNDINRSLTKTTSDKIRSCRLLLVRPTDYIVNLSDLYSYRLIGKLTSFL